MLVLRKVVCVCVCVCVCKHVKRSTMDSSIRKEKKRKEKGSYATHRKAEIRRRYGIGIAAKVLVDFILVLALAFLDG